MATHRSALERTEELSSDERQDTTVYKVLINHEEQYSIWPADCDIPLGLSDTGKSGLKPECLAHVKVVWTDMRPLSLRKKMADDAEAQSATLSFTKHISEFPHKTVKG